MSDTNSTSQKSPSSQTHLNRENLETDIYRGWSKLEGLDMLTGINAFQLDKQRLEAKQRAIYKQQGLEMPEGDDMAVTNYLGDVTINHGQQNASARLPQPSPPPTKQPAETDSPTEPQAKGGGWLFPLAATAAIGAAAAGGALLAPDADKDKSPPPIVKPDSVYELHLLD